MRFNLFQVCVGFSILLHASAMGAYYIATLPSEADLEYKEWEDLEVDFQEIPPELIGGTSSPAPVEKNEWVEGSNKNADDPIDDDINPNALSGDGTDKDGFLFSYNGDKMPVPIIDFDLKQYFPDQAKAANISEKTVILLVQIDERGSVQSAKIASGKAGFGFDEAAMRIIDRIRFSPGYVQGKPVKMSHRVPIRFSLDE
ncbi:energy transducer TonB [Leptospira sp. GIMC2001]|uniref:energy transducer TonB n=1 Tax=Leptospira sp. GIMC2001 TaxID=1513297 RepID=UPI00234BCA00|nr:energy transducer TonB [Leptospira sp. GIMC2001]WCL48679.1 energy transducer TonB [Leptospira sp. GIMC2001]